MPIRVSGSDLSVAEIERAEGELFVLKSLYILIRDEIRGQSNGSWNENFSPRYVTA